MYKTIHMHKSMQTVAVLQQGIKHYEFAKFGNTNIRVRGVAQGIDFDRRVMPVVAAREVYKHLLSTGYKRIK